jgi:hypothetical protein
LHLTFKSYNSQTAVKRLKSISKNYRLPSPFGEARPDEHPVRTGIKVEAIKKFLEMA